MYDAAPQPPAPATSDNLCARLRDGPISGVADLNMLHSKAAARIESLQAALAMATDAADKGDEARRTAGARQDWIAALQADVARQRELTEAIQESRRELWTDLEQAQADVARLQKRIKELENDNAGTVR